MTGNESLMNDCNLLLLKGLLNTKRISEVISVWGMHNAFGNYLEVRLVKWYNPDGVYFSIWSEA
jgi:hypothetical protein